MPWKRRYRKKGRKGKKKASGKPQGLGFADRQRIPLRRFKSVTAPTRLVRMTYLVNWVQGPALTAGSVISKDFSPFQTPTPNMTLPASYNIDYRWHDQLALRYAEYQPHSAHIRCWARDMSNIKATSDTGEHTHDVDGTLGLLSYYKDSNGVDIVPTYVSDPNHVELDTYRAWPGGRYVNVPLLNNRSKSKSISCYVRNKDFKGTAGGANIPKDWNTFDTSHQGNWPTFRVWFSPGRNFAWVAGSGNAVNIYVFITVYMKVRQMYELDPLANAAALANIRTQMARIDAKASVPLSTAGIPPQAPDVIREGVMGVRQEELGKGLGVGPGLHAPDGA